MSDNEKRTKPKYEAPIIVPLGGLARGIGLYCTDGSSPAGTDSYCESGTFATGYCHNGSAAGGYCSTGTVGAAN
jgi:hypothetical protein